MFPISEKYNDLGTVVIGKIESGRIYVNDALLLMPNRVSLPFSRYIAFSVLTKSLVKRISLDLTLFLC